MRYLIEHETGLTFPKPVREHPCALRLVPRPDEGGEEPRVRLRIARQQQQQQQQ